MSSQNRLVPRLVKSYVIASLQLVNVPLCSGHTLRPFGDLEVRFSRPFDIAAKVCEVCVDVWSSFWSPMSAEPERRLSFSKRFFQTTQIV